VFLDSRRGQMRPDGSILNQLKMRGAVLERFLDRWFTSLIGIFNFTYSLTITARSGRRYAHQENALARLWVVWVMLVTPVVAGQLPEEIKLSPIVTKLLESPATTQAQRRAMALFHGQWARIEDPTIQEQAEMALGRYDLADHLLVGNDQVSPFVRAQAALLRGEPAVAVELLQGDSSLQAAVLSARAYRQAGMTRDAVGVLTPWRDRLRVRKIDDAPELTAAARALVILAELEGRPAQDYGLVMSLLGKVRVEIDPLYWPAYVAEARVLMDKDNGSEAAVALMEALRLNPQCGEAWYLLGRLAVRGFNFDTAEFCTDRLREIHSEHLLADTLEAHTLLTQNDAAGARVVIEQGLSRYPQNRELVALLAASEALMFNQPALQSALGYYQELSPNHPLAYYTVGRYLSRARQYPRGQTMLRRAIELDPNGSPQRIELGLLLMQWGDEAQALTELRHAVRLDPFNRQGANQLKLAEELQEYQQIRTEHFVIKYPSGGIDEVLARDMPPELERIYNDLTMVFGYQPANPTVIEILPDEKRFGVRVTGMPDIWAIAASTGDVIAMTPPRLGAHQHGTYDWARVIQHEFVHTLTLNQTGYRIPHWFTEGCAVSQEPGGRAYQECLLLAISHHKLFDLAQINWAFVRPKTPRDRPLAYAQASWIVDYITTRFGFGTIIEMLDLYRDGATNTQAIRQATGLDADQFMTDFKAWGTEQIRSWGLGPQLGDERVQPVLAKGYTPSDQEISQLLDQYPDHADLLRLAAQRAIEQGSVEQATQAILRYAAARPIDPWSDKQRVKLAIRTGRLEQAVAPLEQLDQHEDKTGQWAHQLAKIHRAAGRLNLAEDAIRRALHRRPYDPGYRELAATIHVQNHHLESALHHLKAMAILEPDRAIHQVRLAAIYTKLAKPDQAKAAAKAALDLDPNAPVEAFLKP